MQLALIRYLDGRLLVVITLLAAGSDGLYAQEVTREPKPLSDEIAQELATLTAAIEKQRQVKRRFQDRLPGEKVEMRDILAIRLERERLQLLEAGITFARAVTDYAEQGFAVGGYVPDAVDVLLSHTALFQEAWEEPRGLSLVSALDKACRGASGRGSSVLRPAAV